MGFSHILVTGGLGFIGSAFVRKVVRERPELNVTVLDAVTYAGNPRNVEEIAGSPRYRFVKGDIADAAAVEAAIGSGVDAIINFAAETHVDRSILDPEAFLRTGVFGVHALLEATRRRNVSRFVHVSTDEVYGDVEHGSSRETDPVRPRSPYAASKASGDLLVQAYHTTYGVPAIITRGSNTYGPHQYPEKLIPLFVTNLIDGESVPMYGDGGQMRDWMHVDDHAGGILHVLDHGEAGRVYNLGGGNVRTNREIIERLLSLTGRDWATFVRSVRDREGHDRRYSLDIGLARSIGWEPRIALDEGLALTVAWYKEREDWWRPLKSADFKAYYERQYSTR